MQKKVATSLILILLLLIVLVFLSYRPLGRIGQVLADHKPGWWGAPLWYAVLLFAYGVLVLVLVAQAARFAFQTEKENRWKHWGKFLLGLALVRGLLYSSIAPPWQAPDEHAHFEYAALLGQLKRVPTLDDLSSTLQQQITSSMFQYDFWRLIQRQPVASPPVGFLPQAGINYDTPTHVIDNRYLYYPQVGDDPPLYYVAPAIVYAAFPRLDTTWQLYLMRLTTVCMLVALVGATVWATRRLFPNDVALATGVPTLVALHPMLAHIGSVLNNDVLAAVIITLLLGVLVMVFRSGFSWRRGLAVAGLWVLAMLTRKSTVWTIPLVASIGLAYGMRRKRWIRLGVLAAVLVVLLLSLSLFIPSREARYWTPLSSPWGATVVRQDAPDGACVLRVAGSLSEGGTLGQRLLSQAAFDLRGRTITLSAQVRADSEGQRGTLNLVDADHGASTVVDFAAGPDWRDVDLQSAVPGDALHLEIRLASAPRSVVYFDQVTIAASPALDAQTQWVRNGSGEQLSSLGEVVAVGIGQRLGFGAAVQRVFVFGLDNLRKMLSNPRPLLELAFKSFWGNFGAALVVPLPSLAYRALALACGLSAIGLGVYLYRTIAGGSHVHQPWQQVALATLGLALFFAVGQIIAALLAMYGAWGPQGRYFFPLIWPIAVFLTLGWTHLVPGRTRSWLLVGLTLGWVALDCTALVRLAQYFYHL